MDACQRRSYLRSQPKQFLVRQWLPGRESLTQGAAAQEARHDVRPTGFTPIVVDRDDAGVLNGSRRLRFYVETLCESSIVRDVTR